MKNFIILDGISGSGKTTLLGRVNRARNYEDYHIHRFTATEWVYGTLYDRNVSLRDLRNYERKIQAIWPTLLVTLTCDANEAKKRKEQLHDNYVEQELEQANKLFICYHDHLTVIENKILINTSNLTEKQCVAAILGQIKE
jgi:thymidylate kinase